MKNLARSVVVSFSLFAFAGCSGTSDASAGRGMNAGGTAMLNTTCVVSGEAIDANCTADYMGGKVGFCCDKCITKWNEMDADAKKAAVAKHGKK